MSYIFTTIAFAVLMVFIALNLHPAAPYIVPGILGGMGLSPDDLAAQLLLKGVPFASLMAFAYLVFKPGRPARTRYGLVLVALGLVITTAYQFYLKAQPGGWPEGFATVIVQPVMPTPLTDQIQALGTAEANESTQLTSNVSETVKSINVAEGQFVAAGTVLVQLHDDEERAALLEAERAFNRSAALVKTSAISTARLDADRARLDIARAQMRDRQIVAPFDGMLGLRSISVGDIVNPGTVITTIDDVDPIKLEFSVPESYLAALKTGQAINATAEAYPGQIFNGTVTAIDPRIDPITRAVRVKAELPNPDGHLRAGMLLRTNVIRETRSALMVSEEAIVSQGNQKSVLVVTNPEDATIPNMSGGQDKVTLYKVQVRPVTVGVRRPGQVEITEGLQPGDRVVVEGVIKARPDSQVIVGGEKSTGDTMNRALEFAVPGKQQELQDLKTIEPAADPAATTTE